ncbi:WD40-repeat-containing domain protein [Butyriboletus roseoflavus]|nr:WD40-repeat-containing domain protein [Butyriboletus roseoflavus]
MHHGSGVTAMAASPDGFLLASGGANGTVAVWRVASWTNAVVPWRKHSSSVRGVSFSPDSKQLATVSDDRTVFIWNTSTGEVVAGPLEGHKSSILSITFSPDASQLATGAEDGTIRVWNIVSGELVSSPLANLAGNPILALAWPGEKQLVTAAYNSVIFLNPITGSLLYIHTSAHDSWVRSIAAYCEGGRIATGSEDGRVVLWDTVSTPRQLASVHAGANEVYAVAMSPDGCYLAGGYRDHNIRLWSLEDSVFDDG